MLLQNFVAQNLVQNPSFENTDACANMPPNPSFECTEGWAEYSTFNNPDNTPDLCYEGAVFFPPSSIDAQHGDNYLGIECSTGNPEYAQSQLLQPMQAGMIYCVSFYASVNDQSTSVAPSLGVMFTEAPVIQSPFLSGEDADVQGAVAFDPTQWTLISGTYTALGNEEFIVITGFENVGQMPYPYMYVDQVSVIAMATLELSTIDLCDDEQVLIDAFPDNGNYLWSNGQASNTILVEESGTYAVTATLGFCTQQDSIDVEVCGDATNPDTLPGIIVPVEKTPFFIPNAFTPDGDGVNDIYYITGPVVKGYEFTIFNRWGEPVYMSDDIDDVWTGHFIGGDFFIPDGVYVYRMKATVDGIEWTEMRGHLTIVR